MISCLLVHKRRNSRGLQSSSKIRIASDTLELGRGTACQIHLPDHRVGLLHATIRRAEEGALQVEAEQGALISVNGYLESSAVLRPGMQVTIGPYLLTVEEAAVNVDLVLTMELQLTQADHGTLSQNDPVTLDALGISKRRLGAGFAGLILLVFVLLPILLRAFPAVDDWQASLPVTLTELLSPGPLASGHERFGKKCSACHQRAFQAVTDAACTKCHERVSMHLATNNPFGKQMQSVRCADCHAGHQGKAEAMRVGMSQCADCHAATGTAVAEVRDFDASHPPFHLMMPVGKKLMRIRQDETGILGEKPGLKFSHRVHLAKKGVATPNGDTVLTCRSCHILEESGYHFAAMEMKMTCQQSRCHRVRFEEPAVGIVPHGSETEVMNTLRHAYASWLADEPVEKSKGCPPGAKVRGIVKQTLDCADSLARDKAASTLFRRTGKDLECGLCHEIVDSREKATPWRVLPVNLNRDWQPLAVFPHARHGTVDCGECHDKANSKKSEDMSFPSIKKCRECHGGVRATEGKLRTTCEDCHKFHRKHSTPS